MITGAIQKKKDFRDIQLGAIATPITIPDVYTPDLIKYPKLYQNGQYACGAHAGAMLCAIKRSIELNALQQLSPRFLWTEIKKNDGYTLTQGTDMRSIFKTLQNLGVCDFNLTGNDVSLPIYDYANLNITQPMLDNAADKVISAYAFQDNPTFEQLKSLIYQNQAVLLLIRCDNGFFNTVNPVFTDETYGHFVVAGSYSADGFWIIDSTEQNFSLSVKFIDKKYISFVKEAGTILELSEAQINALITTKQRMLQTLLVLLRKMFKIKYG